MAFVSAAPCIERTGVVAGFVMSRSAYNAILGLLKPDISLGVLFAQGTMYRPDAAPSLPWAAANQQSWLFYNTVSGFYWFSLPTPANQGDAFLGWIVTTSTDVIAISNQQIAVPDAQQSTTVIQLAPVQPIGGSAGSGGPPPNVVLFSAGLSNGDGTFQHTMYWDSRRQLMLIDWGCMAPSDVSNFGGVQIWIKSPNGSGGYNYTRAVDPVDFKLFQQAPTLDYFYYGTVAILPESVPDPPENWTLIAASYGVNGTLNVDVDGHPSGVPVTLQTLGKTDYVTGFTALATYEYSESGDQLFRLSGSWTNAGMPRYKGVAVVMRGMGNGDVILAKECEGSTTFRTDAWPVPDTSKNLTIYAVPIFGDDTMAAIIDGTTPSDQVTVARQGGTQGQEYAPLVTNPAASIMGYVTNGAGQKALDVDTSWTLPAGDTRFGGVIVWYIRGSHHYQATGLVTAADTRIEFLNFPSANEDVIFYMLSVDTNNRSNTYKAGTTPQVTLTLPPPILGTQGQEYTSNVTGFSVAVDYPSTADGAYKARLVCIFTKPNDVTWGDVEIVVYDGVSYTTRAKGTKSPIVFELPVPTFASTYTVYAISSDVNGKANTRSDFYTPKQQVVIGTSAGQFDLSKAKATSYDPNIFTITNGAFKIWAMDGSLIVTGTISSAKLNTTEISVGGGGSKPGKFGVYNASGQQIGFIGVESGYEGGWFKTLGVGGTNKTTAKLQADANGNLSITDGLITVSATIGGYVQTLVINPTTTTAPILIYRANLNQTWIGAGSIWMGGHGTGPQFPTAGMMAGSGVASVDVNGGGSGPRASISVTASYGAIDVSNGATFTVNGIQVLGPRKPGWGAPTGTATRSTFDTGTVTVSALAERVKALIDDLTSHGAIGA
jgi:hypothetical protein